MTALPTNSPGYTVKDVWLNASSLKLLHCQRRYNWAVVRGLRSKDTAEALAFGKAVHKYAECVLSGQPPAAAMQTALSIYNGGEQMLLAQATLAMPAEVCKPHHDEAGPFVERKFFFFWKSVQHAPSKTQFNIWLVGTIDVLTRWADGAIEIIDWKTTRKYKWAEVFESYRLSVQMRFYLWVLYKHGHNIFPLDIANATRAGHLFLRIGAIFLTSKPPLWKFGAPIQLAPQELDAFEGWLDEYVTTHLVPAWLDDKPEGMLNDTCHRGEHPGRACEFAGMCHATNEVEFRQARETFAVESYDPRKF